MIELSLIQKIAVFIIPLLFAITIHEAAHGYAALRLGDTTAKMLGRITLNPLKHIDPIGTILVPGILLATTSFVFGWAKPVPVSYRNLKNPKRDMALVALAGPLSNAFMAILWVLVIKLGQALPSQVTVFLILMGIAGVQINLLLMILNLLPIPPLDGSRVLSAFLSPRLTILFAQFEVYGFFILFALLISGILGQIISPIFNYFTDLLKSLFF